MALRGSFRALFLWNVRDSIRVEELQRLSEVQTPVAGLRTIRAAAGGGTCGRAGH